MRITDAPVNPWAKALGLVEEGSPFSIWDIMPVWAGPDWNVEPDEPVTPVAPEIPIDRPDSDGGDGRDDWRDGRRDGGFIDMRDPGFWNLPDGEWFDTPTSSTWRGIQNAIGLTRGGLLSSLLGGSSARFSTFASPDGQAAIEAASKQLGLDPVEVKSEIAKALGFMGSNPPGVSSALFGPVNQWDMDWFNNIVNERKTIAGVVDKMALDKALKTAGLGTMDWGSMAARPGGIADILGGMRELGYGLPELGNMNQLSKSIIEGIARDWSTVPSLSPSLFREMPNADRIADALARGEPLTEYRAGIEAAKALGGFAPDKLTSDFVGAYSALKDLMTSAGLRNVPQSTIGGLLSQGLGGGLSGLVSANDLAAWSRAYDEMKREGGYGADDRERDYNDAREAEDRSNNKQDDSYGKDEEGRGRGPGFS